MGYLLSLQNLDQREADRSSGMFASITSTTLCLSTASTTLCR